MNSYLEVKNQFTPDFSKPLPRNEYFICLNLKDNIRLIHKLVHFPALLKSYISRHTYTINTLTRKEKWTALHIASIFGLTESVKILLEAGAKIIEHDIHDVIRNLYTYSNVEVFRLLLSKSTFTFNVWYPRIKHLKAEDLQILFNYPYLNLNKEIFMDIHFYILCVV